MRGGEGLQGVETATSLRVRGGKVETMDGPFAETKEHLGGYYLIDVPDLDAPCATPRMIPSARLRHRRGAPGDGLQPGRN